MESQKSANYTDADAMMILNSLRPEQLTSKSPSMKAESVEKITYGVRYLPLCAYLDVTMTQRNGEDPFAYQPVNFYITIGKRPHSHPFRAFKSFTDKNGDAKGYVVIPWAFYGEHYGISGMAEVAGNTTVSNDSNEEVDMPPSGFYAFQALAVLSEVALLGLLMDKLYHGFRNRKHGSA